MAKYAVIIASLLHSGGPPALISGPEVPFEEQKQRFKILTAFRVHEEFAKVELVDNRRGTIKRHNFISPDEAKRREMVLSAEEKAFRNLLPDSLIERRADAKAKAEAAEAEKAKAAKAEKAKAAEAEKTKAAEAEKAKAAEAEKAKAAEAEKAKAAEAEKAKAAEAERAKAAEAEKGGGEK